MIYSVILISLIGPFLGALIGVFRKYSRSQIYMMLAFSAGVMISISLVQLVPSSLEIGSLRVVIMGFLLGGLAMWLLNFAVPHYHHHDHESKLKRVAFFLFIGIFVHNFPEGLAIGAGGLANIKYSLLVALAIAIHDIPETICISAPLSRTLKNRHKAFWLALLSALPTIVGFLISHFILKSVSGLVFAFIISSTAGIMLYISYVEILLPIYRSKMSRKLINSCVSVGVIFVFALQFLLK